MGFLNDIKVEFDKLNADKTAIRKFAITMAIVLSLIGGLVFFKGQYTERAFWLWTVAAAFVLLAFFSPVLLRPFYKIWMGLAFVMGWFVSRIILSVLFYAVITPISLTFRVLGKDLLDEKFDKSASSYWKKRQLLPVDIDRYKKQF